MTEAVQPELPDPMALFPLQTVLYPDGLLPLRIFEPRYLDMVSDSLRTGSPFGIVPIRHGRDTGSTPQIFGLGTVARIVSWDQGDDGFLHVVVEGGSVFEITGHDVFANNLLVGEVRVVEPADESAIPERYEYLGGLLKEILDNNADGIGYAQWHLDSSLWVAHRLAETLPLDITKKVEILNCATSDDKLARIDAYLSELRRDLQNTPQQ